MTSGRPLIRLLACLTLATLSASSHAAEAPPRGCVTVQADAIHDGLGYQHYAEATNGCSKPVQCRLWTNVDPAPQVMSLAPGERDDVVFRRGSPAYEFRTFAQCAFSR